MNIVYWGHSLRWWRLYARDLDETGQPYDRCQNKAALIHGLLFIVLWLHPVDIRKWACTSEKAVRINMKSIELLYSVVKSVSNSLPFLMFFRTYIFNSFALHPWAVSCMEILPKQHEEHCRKTVPFQMLRFAQKHVEQFDFLPGIFYSWLQFFPFSQAVVEMKNEQDGWVKYSAGAEA